MLQSIRDKSKGPILTFIVLAVCLMFAATGVDTILGSGSAGKVANVNGDKVTEQELNEAIFLQKRKLLAQMGENIDPAMLDDKKLREPALQELINRKLLLQLADEQKMMIADSEINKMIASNPDFQENGKFSNQVFKDLLANAGLTPSLYKRLYSMEVLLAQVSSGVVESGFVTDKDSEIDARFTHQTRDIRFITLSLEKEKASVTVTDDEAKAYYEAHPEQFQSEETAVVEYIELKQSDIKPEITEDEIKAAYDQEIASFKSGEQRDVSHILVEVDADTSKEQATALLGDIKKKLASGEDFAELARNYSDDLGSKEAGGLLGILSEEAFPAEFVAAAKGLSEGQVSDIVETGSGLHLIRLNSLAVAKAPAFEERKDALRADLQQAKAVPLYLESLETLKDQAFNSPDLSEPAAAINAQVRESAPVNRNGGSGLFANKKVYSQVFRDNVLKNGENSDVIEISPTQAVVLRVKQYSPSVLQPLDEVIAKARSQAATEKAKEQLAAKAEAVRKDIFAGADIEALANKNAYNWQVALASRRTNPESDQEVVDAAFRLPSASASELAVDKIQKSNGDFVVLAVSNVKDGSITDFNPMETATIRNFVVRAAAMEEFNAMEVGMKARADVDIY